MSRAEVAAFLREFVEELEEESGTVATGVERGDRRPGEAGRSREESDGGGRTDAGTDPDRTRGAGDRTAEPTAGDSRRITFVVGGDSATVTIPEAVEFDVEVESRSPLLQSGKSQAVEFKLSWEVEERHEDDSIDLK